MRRRGSWVGGALALLTLLAPAGATAVETRELSIESSRARDCAERLLPAGAHGAARDGWTAPAEGYLTLRLDGDPNGPDWDLAARQRGAVAASTNFGSAEQVNLWVREGDRIAIQACRLAGGDTQVPLQIDLYEMAFPKASGERISLESVAIGGGEDIALLESLGLDVTHQIGDDAATVALYSDAERALLARAGFSSRVLIADLAARDAADRAREDRASRSGHRRTPGVDELPSERTEYRVYEDFTSEMKALAAAHPGHVRSITIGTSLEGRPIEGLEIAADVNRTDDGRPVFINAGIHHAREWPSGEFPMEFAIDIARSFGSDARVTQMLQDVRVVIVPVMNPDGFVASRSYGTSPIDDDQIATLPQSAAGTGAYRRKNCRGVTPADQAIPCAARPSGVDLNRNYGAYYGGPGSASDPTSQAYRGPNAYSEPESQAFLALSESVHPTVVISNHTFTEGRWLRQPGFDAAFMEQQDVGQTYDDNCGMGTMGAVTPDEAGMDALGDAMAAASEPDWISELGYETLCDITGATEDWNYFAQGAYGYTPEARGSNFHANFATMVVSEYIGTPGDPYDGIRGAFILGGEEAADTANHGVIEGNAPAGAALKIRKPFSIPTCEDDTACADGNGDPIDYEIDTRMTVPASGEYAWHVNPSSRPDLDPGPGRVPAAETWTMTCRQAGQPANDPQQVLIGRGEEITVDWRGLCGADSGSGGDGGGDGDGGDGGGGGGTGVNEGRPPKCEGREATIIGTRVDDEILGTEKPDVIVAKQGDDVIKTGGGKDLVCGRDGTDKIVAGAGGDTVFGQDDEDKLRGQRGNDRLTGGAGVDRVNGGPGRDVCPDRVGRDKLRSC